MTRHRVLVVGTNVALLAISIAERLRCHVVALLPDASLLEVVRSRAMHHGVDNLITFEVGAVTELGYLDDGERHRLRDGPVARAVVAPPPGALRDSRGSFLGYLRCTKAVARERIGQNARSHDKIVRRVA